MYWIAAIYSWSFLVICCMINHCCLLIIESSIALILPLHGWYMVKIVVFINFFYDGDVGPTSHSWSVLSFLEYCWRYIIQYKHCSYSWFVIWIPFDVGFRCTKAYLVLRSYAMKRFLEWIMYVGSLSEYVSFSDAYNINSFLLKSLSKL